MAATSAAGKPSTSRSRSTARCRSRVREAVVANFQQIWIDDLNGASDDRSHPGDQSIFTTTIASGIKRGTAIVTAIRTSAPTADDGVATVNIREHRGSAAGKRAALSTSADSFNP